MDISCHSEFLHGILGAPQDVSRPVLEDLLNQGYTSVLWQTNPSATDSPCLVKNGERFDLYGFLQGLMHDAPIFEKTHVGCHCIIIVSGEGKPDVTVNAFGIVSTAEMPTEVPVEPPIPEPTENEEGLNPGQNGEPTKVPPGEIGNGPSMAV